MNNQKKVAIEIPEMGLKKIYSVPTHWDDRMTVSKLVQAFDLFGDTEEGAHEVIQARFHSGKKRNSNVSIFGWDVLLEHTPKEFFEKQDIYPIELETDDAHVITLLEEEEELPMDDYREQVIQTIGNYKIVRMYVEGERDEEGEEFYSKWSFIYQTENSEGFVAYYINPINEEQAFVNSDFQRRFYSIEEVETFIRSKS